ncbi:hypothetical protein KVM92_00345 [Helicobacter pylori]|nr:hypothetical protein KVM92_00345 [Helicobacter pylori]
MSLATVKYRRLYSVYLNYVFAYKGSSLRNAAFMSFDQNLVIHKSMKAFCKQLL